jgi:ubiquitin carboxyl-terminal hydrolase 9/24
MIMMNDDSQCVGLMRMGDQLLRDNYNYRDIAMRYKQIIINLARNRAVSHWMGENRSCWAWMDDQQQSRGDNSGRRGGGAQQHAVPQSDADSDEYDDDDSDSRYEESNVDQLVVKNAGVPDVNGEYKRTGSCDGVPKYSKQGLFRGREETYMLFRCRLSDETRRWYISIVPHNGE